MSPNHVHRRAFLQSCALLGGALAAEAAGGLSRRLPGQAGPLGRGGPDEPEVPNEIVARIMKDRFGDRPIQRGHVHLEMPEMAEDGRVVPVAIETDLPATEEQFVKAVYLIVDHNPDPLVTVFHLTPALGPVAINTRIKMKRTTWIRAIAETSTGELWADYLKVATSLNGCG